MTSIQARYSTPEEKNNPFLIGICSSNQKPFSGAKESRAEEAKIEHTIRKVQGAKGRKISVLFLFIGFDTLTTDNNTWADLISRFRDVDFFLTSVCPAELAESYPSVLTTRFGFAWAHLSVSELKDATRQRGKEPARETLFQNPKYYRWTYWMDTMYQKKMRQQNEQNEQTRSTSMSELERRLTLPRKRVLKEINTISLPAKACELCGRSDAKNWARGQQQSDTVQCRNCDRSSSPIQTFVSERCSHTLMGSASNPQTATGYGCAVAGCKSSGLMDLHFGYSLCGQHVTQDRASACTAIR